jgi:hypothetical protein
LHYLCDRLENWSQGEDDFFAQSGEWNQRHSTDDLPERPPGYVQGLVLLTTPQLFAGEEIKYEEEGRTKKGHAVEVVKMELRRLRQGLTRKPDAEIEFFVALVPFRNFGLAFERSLAVLKALHPLGRTGKEVWVNLTAADNTLVHALQLASSLTGIAGRHYCINAPQGTEPRLAHPINRRVLGSPEDTFWIDLPVVAVQGRELRTMVLSILESAGGPVRDESVLAQLKQRWYPRDEADIQSLPEIDQFRRQYLHPMEAQKIIERVGDHIVRVGPLWSRVKSYFELAQRPTTASSLRQLATSNPEWAHWEEI